MDKQEKGISCISSLDTEGNSSSGRAAYMVNGLERRMFVAAAAVILLAVGLFTYFNTQKDTKDQTAYRNLIAEKRQRVKYVLKDGSRVILHGGSRLKIPRVFGIENRELYLEGEAYFDVATDSTKPFVVHSQHAYTRVLGTKFLVKAWSGIERKVEVVVAEGKVALGSELLSGTADKQQIVITRHQKGVLTDDHIPVVINDIDLDWYLGWTKGRLVFDNRPLSEIIPRLERWYGIDIQVANNKIAAKKLTAEIDYRQPAEEVLRNMALSLGLEIEEKDRIFTLSLKE